MFSTYSNFLQRSSLWSFHPFKTTKKPWHSETSVFFFQLETICSLTVITMKVSDCSIATLQFFLVCAWWIHRLSYECDTCRSLSSRYGGSILFPFTFISSGSRICSRVAQGSFSEILPTEFSRVLQVKQGNISLGPGSTLGSWKLLHF